MLDSQHVLESKLADLAKERGLSDRVELIAVRDAGMPQPDLWVQWNLGGPITNPRRHQHDRDACAHEDRDLTRDDHRRMATELPEVDQPQLTSVDQAGQRMLPGARLGSSLLRAESLSPEPRADVIPRPILRCAFVGPA